MEEYRYEPGPDQRASMNGVAKPVVDAHIKKEKVEKAGGEVSYPKIFAWLGLGLLTTGAIALGIPYIFMAMTKGFTENIEAMMSIYIALFIVSLVLMLPSAIMIGFNVGSRNSTLMKVGYFVYVIGMGLLISTLFVNVYLFTYDSESSTAALNPQFLSTISLSFLITAGCFLLMGLIGHFTKHMNAAIPVVMTAAIGVVIMSIVNVFLRVEMLYWVIDFVIFGVILLVTAIDMHNIRKICERSKGMNGTNLAIYCAYSLYVDFINILVRVIYYVLILTNRSKN